MQSNFHQFDKDAGTQWQTKLSENFGNALQKHRTEQGLSAAKLSELTKQAGFQVTRSTIAKMESNSRGGKLDIAELLILSAALDVPPGLLLFPGYPSRTVEITPAIRFNAATRYPSFYAVEWLAGRARTPSTPTTAANDGTYTWEKGTDKWQRLVQLVEEREHLAETSTALWHGALMEVIEAGLQTVSKQTRHDVEQLLEEQQQTSNKVEELNKQIKQLGGEIDNG